MDKEVQLRVCQYIYYAQFYPMKPEQERDLVLIREDPDRGFLCIDWDDEDPHLIFGDFTSTANYQSLDFILTPCNYNHKEIDPEGLPIHEKCIYDAEE